MTEKLWINDDGLVVRFGTLRSEKAKVASYVSDGPRRYAEFLVQASDLPDSDTGGAAVSEILSYDVRIPEGAYLEAVEIVPGTTWTGTETPVLSVGLTPSDELDPGDTGAETDWYIDAATIAELNAGGENVAGWLGSGDGTVTTFPSVVTVTVSTTINPGGFTAGDMAVRVRWSVPENFDDTLIQS